MSELTAAEVLEKLQRWAADAHGEIEMSQRIAVIDYVQELQAALRDANRIVVMTRQHLTSLHPECAYTGLGVMNDATRAALVSTVLP